MNRLVCVRHILTGTKLLFECPSEELEFYVIEPGTIFKCSSDRDSSDATNWESQQRGNRILKSKVERLPLTGELSEVYSLLRGV